MNSMMTTAQFIVYTTSAFSCPYCIRAKHALEENNLTYEERDIAVVTVKAELLQRLPTVRTIPQIFTSTGEHIGGCDELLTLLKGEPNT